MEMTGTEWMIAFGQVALVVAVSFVVLLAATSLIRFQLLTERVHESEELGEGEDRLFRLNVLNRIASARKQQRPISVVMLRLPTAGTDAKTAQAALRKWVRTNDDVAVCGEDLVGLLLDCGSEKSDIAVKRLVERAVSEKITGVGGWRFGVAGYPEHGFKTSVLYQRALDMIDQAAKDQALIAGMAPPEEVADESAPPSKLVDPVTGLVREDQMIGVMRRYVAHERRADHPVSMIYFDIDQFIPLAGQAPKKISDALLKELAKFIGSMIREQDMMARFGDGGFVVTMPAYPDAAMLAAQRVVNAVRKHVFKTGSDVKISLSAGVAGYPDVLGSAIQYFVAAETALRNARLRGRNQCIKFDHSMRMQPESDKNIDHL